MNYDLTAPEVPGRTDEALIGDELAVTLARAPRRRGIVNGAAGTVMVLEQGNDAGPVFAVAGLPKVSLEYLVALGLWTVLGRAEDMRAAYAKLEAGDVPRYQPRELKLSNWRLAIAHALVDVTKKTPDPLTLDAAKIVAAGLPADTVRAYKVDGVVIKHYNRLQGVTPPGVAALVAAAE